MTRNSKLFLWAVFLMICGSVAALADTNVALGKPVTLVGTFGVLRAGSPWPDATTYPVAAGSTITDGIFRPGPNITEWQDGTVWWDTQALDMSGAPVSADNAIVVDLQGLFTIDGLILQGDDNDDYQIWYNDASNVWQPLWLVPQAGLTGIVTRPNPLDNTEVFTLGSSVVTNALRVTGGSNSDNYYAVSELQAFGTSAVPEPETISLAFLGMPFVLRLVRRRRM